MKRIYPTLRLFVVLVVILTASLAGYVVLYLTAGHRVSFIYMTGLSGAVLITALVATVRFVAFRRKLLHLIHKLTDMINSSFKLSEMLYNFFDNTLFKIYTTFSDSSALKEMPHLHDLEASIKKIMQEEDYFSSGMQWRNPEMVKFFEQDFHDRIGEYIRDIDHLFEFLRKTSEVLVTDLKKRVDVYRQKETLQEMIVEYGVNSHILSKLLDAIIDNSTRTGENVSSQIVEMKRNIDTFLGDINNWQNEFLAKTSRINFDKLMARYQVQKEEYTQISQLISANYETLNSAMMNFVSSVSKINENIQFIKEIADSINILSINASIEAARQGSVGRGFKVIAGEIKQLSHRTESFVTDIVTRIEESDQVVSETSRSFQLSTGNILEKITDQKAKIDQSYDMLKDYYENFNSMITSMKQLTGETNNHIDKFYVILQHYDIEEQELNNLRLILDKCVTKYRDTMDEMTRSVSEELFRELATGLLVDAQQIVTTRLERETLQNIFREYGIQREEISEGEDVEIF